MTRPLLFDLDGNLTNPKEGFINSVCYAVGKMGIEDRRPEELRQFIALPLLDSFLLCHHLSLEQGNTAVEY